MHKRNKILIIVLLLLSCQPNDRYHRESIKGRVIDSNGNPVENITITQSFIVSYYGGIVFNDTNYTTNVSFQLSDSDGTFVLPSGLIYFSDSGGNDFGCDENDEYSKVLNTYIKYINQFNDTTIVLLANQKTILDDDWETFKFYADTIVYLEQVYFDYEEFPNPYQIPDIIIHNKFP